MAGELYNSSGTPRSPSNEATGDDVRQNSDAKASVSATDPAGQRSAPIGILTSQAEDLDKIKDAVVDSANMARNIWVLFLSFGTYLVVAVGSVTHRQLFLEGPIRLPLLNVDLPLVAFFVVAPALFLIFHVYLLMHLKLMSAKVQRYNSLLYEFGLERSTEHYVRLQLPDFMFVQYLAGPGEGWKSLMHWLLVLVAWLTVAIGPLIVLLLIQLQFLPYHLEGVTWTQRIIIILDIGLLWWFWPKILQGGSGGRFAIAMRTSAVIVSAALIVFSVCISAFPGEAFYGKLVPSWTENVFEGRVYQGRPAPWFSNRLILPLQHFVDADALEKIIERNQKEANQGLSEYALSLRHRNLTHAVLDYTDLRQVDLTGAQLQGASLFSAHLQGSDLSGAYLQGVSFGVAYLQGANLSRAHLQGALLDSASLQGANLSDAHLEGATLKSARLQAALLFGAHLEGASLDGANLQGASLDGANLQDASLNCVNSQYAPPTCAHLEGASLKSANLQGASLEHAGLWLAHGTPDPGNPPRVWLKAPQLQAPKDDQPVQWEKDALLGVNDNAVKNRIRDALARLSLREKDAQDRLSENYWIDLGDKTSEADYEKDLPDRLTRLACMDTFVARGLVTNYDLVQEPSDHPRMDQILLAAALVAAAESDTADCPGVKGLNVTSIARLRRWAVGVEIKTK